MLKTYKSKLIYVEGLREKNFLGYLNNCYSRKDFKITIRNANGGSPESIVKKAVNEQAFYNEKIVVLDNDHEKRRTKILGARTIAKKDNIELIESDPCFEQLLLQILSDKNALEYTSSIKCKKAFENNYLKNNSVDEIDAFRSIFSKKLLNNRRKSIPILDRLIIIMERFN